MIRAATAVFYLWTVAPALFAQDIDPFRGGDRVIQYAFGQEMDRDFDGHPDDWMRRRGPEFPPYVRVGIDIQNGYVAPQAFSGYGAMLSDIANVAGASGGAPIGQLARSSGQLSDKNVWQQSLRIEANGGFAAIYSRPIPIVPDYAFILQAFIRSEKLVHDAAVVSVSLLDEKGQRIQRYLSQPVSGHHENWVQVRIRSIHPRSDAAFLVVGCHMVHNQKKDISGAAWFDEITVSRLPQVVVTSNYRHRFVDLRVPLAIEAGVRGVKPETDYELRLDIVDAHGNASHARRFPLAAAEAGTNRVEECKIQWLPESMDYGFYRVNCWLYRGSVPIALEKTSLVVLDELTPPRPGGEFGWTVRRRIDGPVLDSLTSLTQQAGINWIKVPLWSTTDGKDKRLPVKLNHMFEGMNRSFIRPVGVLDEPPQPLRGKFSDDWSGVSELFALEPATWFPVLEPVVARYSSEIHTWQLGVDRDSSFDDPEKLKQILSNTRTVLDRVRRDSQVGVPWTGVGSLDDRLPPASFVSILSPFGEPISRLVERLQTLDSVTRWVTLRGGSRRRHSADECASDLARRMIAAKIGGASAIFVTDVFDPQRGLVDYDGTPSELFLPWRTMSLALQQTRYLGSLQLGQQSQNHIFVRDGRAVMLMWNPLPVTEELYFGPDAHVSDVWGRSETLDVDQQSGRQRVRVGAVPVLVHNCLEEIIRWRMAVRFERGVLPSARGEQLDALLGKNTFQGIDGRVDVEFPREWDVSPRNGWKFNLAAGEDIRLPMVLTLPSEASLGRTNLWIHFTINADHRYRFRVRRPYQIGLGDVTIEVQERFLKNGDLEILQLITNNTQPREVLNFRCSLFVFGRQRQIVKVTKLAIGQSQKIFTVD
ncbi:MAG: hypothetical protein ABGZ17_04935, partial [Planctomycetaceae bacterium]